MALRQDITAESALILSHTLLDCLKYSHTSIATSLHLIDCQIKSKSTDFLDESKLNLRNVICDLFKRNSEVNFDRELKKLPLERPFQPIKVSKGQNVCSRCEKIFTVRINQFSLNDLQPDVIQFRKDIAGKKFSEHPSVNHLNLIDYSWKAYDFVPRVMLEKYVNYILSRLLVAIDIDIKFTPVKFLPFVLPKLVTVLKLLNIESASPSSSNFYYQIIDSILEKHYDEPMLLLRIWKSLFTFERFIVCAFEKLTDHLPYRSNEKLKWALIMASFLRFDFYGAWVRGSKLRNFSNCPVSSALLTGNYEQMKILLEYGFLQNYRPHARYNVFLRHLIRADIMTDLLLSPTFEHAPIGNDPTVREVLMFLVIRFIYKMESESGRGRDVHSKLDKSFYLLWSMIPNPFVTKQQLIEEKNHLFLPYPNNHAVLDLKEVIDNVINGYDEMAFGPVHIYEPRSLHHLSSCCIRKALMSAGNLPHGVRQLNIPKNLQIYLLPQSENGFGKVLF
ncbi:SOCS box domain-containing protein [Trichonephila inaurata madagascariensis]|uniref:SOCS box domain-containing protein n=1 Tax=Trichonephila inaurata madagascariensis TaxID=2747483 RepID=A0A8X7BUB3_9ARAC|nr:SOCS box domain-containing protein [Trichonephila inaurata madagascariensis]